MPLKIMKLAIAATSVINVNPLVTRLFYEATATSTGPTTLSIDPASFFSDTGDPATVLPALSAENSSYEVFINGVLQMEDLTAYTPGAYWGRKSCNHCSGWFFRLSWISYCSCCDKLCTDIRC
ncbi:DUF4183 domain-containing protein [Peribacillus simplex]|uniref:DUF4183 domain-containing protein n=1 Tax=Peribacillus simplex TaxID=1478 RepID=UPI00333719FB